MLGEISICQRLESSFATSLLPVVANKFWRCLHDRIQATTASQSSAQILWEGGRNPVRVVHQPAILAN